MPLSTGTRFGPYEILAPLGAGGMGEVYRARDTRLGRDVALKILPHQVADDPSRRQRFELEARAVAALNHPNIVAIYDVGEDRGVSYIVTELVEGESLRDAKFGLRKLLDVAAQISGGLAAAHAAGIVHRDLKPENILVARDGRAKILDFGLAKVVETRDASGATQTMSPQTEPGMVMGTVGYMSPEQARGQPLDPRSDIFSLGTVLYELASGKHPFPGVSAVDVMSGILKEDPPPIEGELSPSLDRIVRRCLEKEPSRRFQSAADLAFALESVTGTSATAQIPAAPTTPEVTPKPTRRTALWAGGVAAAGALGFGAARWLGPGVNPPPRYRVIDTAGERISSAVLHPDGKIVVYVAIFDGKPAVFRQQTEGAPPHMLALPAGARPRSLSARGELAFVVGSTLYRTPLADVAPRAVAEDVLDANWSGDGESLQVVRHAGNKYQIEFPPGHVIFESDLLLVGVALAPQSGRSSFHLVNHDAPQVLAVDRSGHVEKFYETQGHGIWDMGAVWSPDEREVWMSPVDGSDPSALVAYSGNGRQRLIARLPGEIGPCGISANGAVLLTLRWNDQSARFMPPDGSREVEIAMGATPKSFSPDGSSLILGSRPVSDYETYLKRSDGSAPVLLGKGSPRSISPDGKWVQVFRRSLGFVLIPTGPGQERNVEVPGIELPEILAWRGEQWLVVGHEKSRGPSFHLFFLFDPSSGAKQKLKLELEGEPAQLYVSPDGTRILFSDFLGKWSWAEVDGAAPSPLPGLRGAVYGWTADNRGLYVGRPAGPKLTVDRFDIESGQRTPWKEFDSGRPDVTIGSFAVTPDGRAWAYALNRTYSRLVLVDGLK